MLLNALRFLLPTVVGNAKNDTKSLTNRLCKNICKNYRLNLKNDLFCSVIITDFKMAKKITSAESRARAYTSSELKRLGWNTKHPNSGGNILEEQEAKNYDERFNELLGKDRPDFLIYKDSLPIGIIECKNEKAKIESAIDQGIGYADKLSKKYFNVRIAIGVSGNEEDGVVVRSLYKLDNGEWEEIKGNGYPLTQLLSEKQLEQVLLNKKASIDLEIPTESEFYEVAEKINKIMHEAKVNKSDRAVYLASIILAMQEGDVDTRPNVILEQINANVESALRKKNKSSLKHIFAINGNKQKLRKQLPLIFHNLDRLNIRALMNSGADILGKFYETFLRYGNDAKELGIVFTPRHMTNLMVELIDVNATDIVYDPACGTGGFLISAFTRMKNQVINNDAALEKIKLEQLIGTDTDTKISALAVANMIFRGDGRSNIFDESCFSFNKFEKPFATKGLMNPPFALTETENMFLEHLNSCIKPGGLTCTIFTYAVLAETKGKNWRAEFLSKNQILGVITVPDELFYPTSATTVILITRPNTPHNGKIWFGRISNDGYTIRRKKRIETEGSQLQKTIDYFKTKQSEKGFSIYTELDKNDPLVELVPEAYIESTEFDKDYINSKTEQLFREFTSFSLKFESQLKAIDSEREKSLKKLSSKQSNKSEKRLSELFEINYGKNSVKSDLVEGGTISISSQGVDNGCCGFYDLPITHNEIVITVPRTGSIGYAFVQEYKCNVDDNCLVMTLREGISLSIEELYFIAAIIREEKWRYKYGRQVTPYRLGEHKIDFSKLDYKRLNNFRNRMTEKMKL